MDNDVKGPASEDNPPTLWSFTRVANSQTESGVTAALLSSLVADQNAFQFRSRRRCKREVALR
jgi:hypothetical protein